MMLPKCLLNSIQFRPVAPYIIMADTPWAEKYRPQTLSNVVLDDANQQLFGSILEKQTFPNLLLYGPPGTGKTTTIINLVREYQECTSRVTKDHTMHLNASDERGIDIIRTQILQFVSAHAFFTKGLKFVILDEVDSMTKNAQVALRHIIQEHSTSVRFCLICNYISRIDKALQSMFVLARFNTTPRSSLLSLLDAVAKSESVSCRENDLCRIIDTYGSDIRSMINALQLFAHSPCEAKINDSDVEILYSSVLDTNIDLAMLHRELRTLSECKNCHERDVIYHLLDWLIRTKVEKVRANRESLAFFIISANPSTQDSPYHAKQTLLQLRRFQL